LSTFLGEALENEVDNRLHSAQSQLGEPVFSRDGNDVYVGGEWNAWLTQAEENPELRSLVTSGLFFLVTNLDGSSARQMGAVPNDLIENANLEQLTPDKMLLQTVTTDGQRVRVLMRPIVLPQFSAEGISERVVAAVIVGESLERQEDVLEVVN